ncbi:hypothetical protein K458DRAFT_241444, partial [Lentithecium fluviatile CBS 122367]
LPRCPHATQPPVPGRYAPTTTVIVRTTPDIRTFYAPTCLLKHYSGFFRAIIRDGKEGLGHMVQLPHDEPDVFGLFTTWIHIRSLYISLTPEGKIPTDWALICKAYVFGDTYKIPELCNDAIDLLFHKGAQISQVPDSEAGYIYKNTTPETRLRKYFVRQMTLRFEFRNLTKELDKYPKELLADVIV